MEIVPPHSRPTSLSPVSVTYEPSERQVPPELRRHFRENCILSTDRRFAKQTSCHRTAQHLEVTNHATVFSVSLCFSMSGHIL